jgi:magnesium transporter
MMSRRKHRRFVKKISQKAGLAPGTLVHVGEERTEKVRIEVIDYNETSFEQRTIQKVEECFPFKDKPTTTWINVDGVHEVDIIEKIGKHFGVNELVLEDIVNTEQRPFVKDFDKFIFVVLKMVNYDEQSDEIITEQVSLIVGPSFVISFQEGKEGDVFDPVRERIRNGKNSIRRKGSDYLAHALIDATVDCYFVILEQIGLKLEEIEDETLSNPSSLTIEKIHRLKRNLIFLRKAVWPLREIAGFLERCESEIIQKSTGIYFRDIYDHSLQLMDIIETLRDLAAGMLDIYLSSLSNKLNEVMKVLTIISTIFIPLTFLAGIYGMNFKYMPELEWHYGYYALWVGMIALGVSMLFLFKRKKWL